MRGIEVTDPMSRPHKLTTNGEWLAWKVQHGGIELGEDGVPIQL